MKTSTSFGLSGPDMRVAEKGVPRSAAPNALPAHKGIGAELIGELRCWHPGSQGRQRRAVAQTGGSEDALAIGKASPSVAGSQSRLSTLIGGLR